MARRSKRDGRALCSRGARAPQRVALAGAPLRPVDRTFFASFAQQTQLCIEACRRSCNCWRTPRSGWPVREIEAIEKRADSVVDEIRAALRRSLFPPYGRMVVHELSNSIDDILDVTEDAAQSCFFIT